MRTDIEFYWMPSMCYGYSRPKNSNMKKEERVRALSLLAQTCLSLDRLQVELCEDTPYDIPNADETRKRILAVFGNLEEVIQLLEKASTLA